MQTFTPPPSAPLVDEFRYTSVAWYLFFTGLFQAVGSGQATGTLVDALKSIATIQADLAATVAPAPEPFAPTDESGAALTFTGVSVQTVQSGNLVYVYGTLTYPVTANGSAAAILLPIAVPNNPYAAVPGTLLLTGETGSAIVAVANTSTATFAGASGALTNANLSGKVLVFFLTYPAS